MMNRRLPSAICAAVSVGADACSAAHTEAPPNTTPNIATVRATAAFITTNRFMILRLLRPTRAFPRRGVPKARVSTPLELERDDPAAVPQGGTRGTATPGS